MLIWSILSLWAALGTASFIEVLIEGRHPRIFNNASLGLEHLTESGHHCPVGEGTSGSEEWQMNFTPNRRQQNASNIVDSQLGFVVALGGHSNGVYDYGKFGALNGLLSVWNSWKDNFFAITSNVTSLVLLLDERDFHKYKLTDNKAEYIDIVVSRNMGAKPVNCVRHRHRHTSFEEDKTLTTSNVDHDKLEKFMFKGCSNELHLDQNYRVYYLDVHGNSTSGDRHYQQPLIIFASVYKFPPPDWASGVNMTEEDALYNDWRPSGLRRAFQTNYGYVKLTNWYSYHMFRLSILDYFDYVGKLDTDVTFMQPFPEPNLPQLIAERQAKVLITHQEFYHDAPQVCQGISLCLNSFIDTENKYCRHQHPSNVRVVPAGYTSHAPFWENGFITTILSYFTVLWLGLYASPETMRLAKHWNNFHPRGMWDYRWGDQQYWPRPLAMFSANSSIEQDIFHYSMLDCQNGTYMKHKEWPLFATLRTTSYFEAEGLSSSQRLELFQQGSKKFIY